MIELRLLKVGKRYNREWVLRGIEALLPRGASCAVLGSNGSGKSTLLKLLMGYTRTSEGSISRRLGSVELHTDDLYRKVSFSAPYLELYEEFTLRELIDFHCSLKPLRKGLKRDTIAERMGLASVQHRRVAHFSSGMKQRVRLALAMLSDTALVLLDEPCANLDSSAVEWYRALVAEHGDGRTLVVASNYSAVEYDFCSTEIRL